jgi:hypothetical protein
MFNIIMWIVSPINKFRENPRRPIPFDTPHMSVYSSLVYASTGQG